MFLIGFPLLLVPFAIYNIVAFLMPGVSWTGTLATVRMMSGANWAMSGGDVLVTLAVLLLFVEMMKAVGVGRRNFVDHGLSLLLFGAMLAEFVLVKQAASGDFFLIVVMAFLDLLGGFVVSLTLRAARRKVLVEPISESTAYAEPAPVRVAPVLEKIEPAPPSTEHVPS